MKHYNVDSEYWKAEIEKYMVTTPCEKCGGARLKPFPLAVRINGKNIHEFCLMPVDKAYEFVTDLYLTLSDFQMKIGKQILDEVRARLKFLCDV